MQQKDKLEILQRAYDDCVKDGRVKTRTEFAELLGVNRSTVSSAFSGNETYLTDRFVNRVREIVYGSQPAPEDPATTVPLVPTGARAGTLADWCAQIHDYDCERIVSPIRGADFAIQVTGDSMSPEYPSGSHVVVKRIDEEAFIAWGEVYLLDTVNGPVLKRVRKTDQEGAVECVSLNPAYQPFTVACKDVRGWYRVMMCLSLK